jgi:hypothetical protein
LLEEENKVFHQIVEITCVAETIPRRRKSNMWRSNKFDYYWKLKGYALLFAVLLGAGQWCWYSKDRGIGEQAVVQFHNEFNSGKYQEIYENGDADARKGQSQNDVVAYFDTVHQRLGEVKTSTRVGWKIRRSKTETVATLHYDTEFTKGKGHEQFIFVLSDGKVALHMYQLTSPLMPSK